MAPDPRAPSSFIGSSTAARSAGLSVPSEGKDIALVGRDDILKLLEAEMAAMGSGAFRVVLVAGGAGVGKTRLVAEAMKRPASGTVRMSARSYRWGGTTSFGPWVEALDRYLRGLPQDDIDRLCGPARNDLAAILSSVQPATEGPRPEPDRGRLLDALAYLFDNLSRESSVMIAFDDLHLADSSAWEALRYLGRRLETAPVGVFATARPAQLRSRLISREVLLGLDDDGLLTRIDLAPLTRSEVTALAHEVLRADSRAKSTFVPEPLVNWLMKRSLGHPLFVIGLLRALTEEGADLSDPRLEQIPHKVSERVALDLHALDPDHRQVLETLAVLDQRCDLDDLHQLTDRSLQELGNALESLSKTQLVAEQRSGLDLRYEIAHPIIQNVIYEEIGSARRAALHGQAARMMVSSGRLGAAASHYALAGVRDDDEAVEALFLAMEQANERDLYQEALAVLGTLLQLLPAGDPRWTRVLESVTLESEWVLSHLAEGEAGTAIEAMNRVVEVLEDSDDHQAQALARFHLAAFLSFGEARLDDAEQACQEAVELFRRADDTHGELVATNELAWIAGCRGDFARNADMAVEILSRAEEGGLSHVAAVAAGTAAFAHGVLGRFKQSGDLFERALELAREADVGYRVAWAHAQGGHYHLALSGQLEEALAWGEAALDDDPSAPDATAYEDLGASYWLQGRLQEAAAMLERSPVRRPILGSRRRAWGSALAARVYAEMGQWARAVSNLERATSIYDDWFFIWSSWSNWAKGVFAWIEGDAKSGLAELITLAQWLQDAGAMGYEPLVLNDLAEIAADAGDIDRCQRASKRCSEVAEQTGALLASWLASLVSARYYLCKGDHQTAVEQSTEAAAGLDRAGYSLLAATSREVLGRALAKQDRSAAAETLKEAAEQLDACGAVWRRDRVLASLTELGTRGRRAAAAVQGPSSLTSREREVAALTAQGRTAQEVGERLFIGKRTVETHLANIYAKLGITSKRELIQRAAEFGL